MKNDYLANNQVQHFMASDAYEPSIAISSQEEDFLRKTIEIKNKNIDELLRELRETKEIYQEYKNQYLSEQKKLKSKVNELQAKLDVQMGEMERFKHVNNKLRSDLQIAQDKDTKMNQVHSTHVKEINENLKDLESKYRELQRQNINLKEKNEQLAAKCVKIEEKSRIIQQQFQRFKDQMKSLKQEYQSKQHRWQQEKRQWFHRENEREKKKNEKQRMNDKLNLLENRIKDTLRKI